MGYMEPLKDCKHNCNPKSFYLIYFFMFLLECDHNSKNFLNTVKKHVPASHLVGY